jgi:beta-galactosidase
MEHNFNQGWRFRREGGAWENVTLPHDAMITEPRSADAPGGVNSGYFPGGKYEYEKCFTVTDTNKSYVLHFEGFYQNCTVSVGTACHEKRDNFVTSYLFFGEELIFYRC